MPFGQAIPRSMDLPSLEKGDVALARKKHRLGLYRQLPG